MGNPAFHEGGSLASEEMLLSGRLGAVVARMYRGASHMRNGSDKNEPLERFLFLNLRTCDQPFSANVLIVKNVPQTVFPAILNYEKKVGPRSLAPPENGVFSGRKQCHHFS